MDDIVAALERAVCLYVDYWAVTGGALTPRDIRRHEVSVWSSQGRRGILQGDSLILLKFVCVLDSVFARSTDHDDVIALPCGGRPKHLVMQMTSGS